MSKCSAEAAIGVRGDREWSLPGEQHPKQARLATGSGHIRIAKLAPFVVGRVHIPSAMVEGGGTRRFTRTRGWTVGRGERTPPAIRVAVLVLAILAGLVVGSVATSALPATEGPIRISFSDGDAVFCPDGGPISSSIGMIDPDSPGFATPEEALGTYLNWRRAQAAGAEVPQELRAAYADALAPLAQLELPERVDVSSDVVYFERAGSEPGTVDARLVVERVRGGYFPVAEYICSYALTDPVKWEAYENAAREMGVTR